MNLGGQYPNVLLTIRPKHAEDILDGRKRWEYRRVAPACDPPYRLVLYASGDVKAAIGSCWVLGDYEGYPPTLIIRTVHQTPSDALDVRDYFDGADTGHALLVVGPRRFDEPVERSSLEAAGAEPTQNFRYLPDINPVYAESNEVSI